MNMEKKAIDKQGLLLQNQSSSASTNQPRVVRNKESVVLYTEDSQGDSKTRYDSFSQEWVEFCMSLNQFFERLFYRLGFRLASNPALTIMFGLIVPCFLTGGFYNYKLLQRTEELYIPDNSQAFDDLDRAEKHFPSVRVKAEQFILKPHHTGAGHNTIDVLGADCFRVALQIHRNITQLPGFRRVCIKNHLNECSIVSPLEIFHYDSNRMGNVSKTLENVFKNDSVILSNGRQAYTSYPYFFGRFNFDYKKIKIAKTESIHNMYLVQDPISEGIYKELARFDRHYTHYMEKIKAELHERGFTLMYTSALGIETSISDSATQEMMLIPFAFVLMTIFCAITLLRFKNQVGGHFLVAFAGILCLFLGIASAFGLIMLFGQPYIAFAGVLPFLVLGVGIDNIFIIIHAIDRQPASIRGPARVAKALSQIGASITMATTTTIVAFFVSMFTAFPAIRFFCFYAGLSILFCYVQVLTIFVALLSFEVQRIESKRRDVVFCCTAQVTGDIWEITKDRISLKMMKIYSRFLLKKPVKYAVLALSLIMTALGIIGAINIDQSFDKVVLCARDSPYVQFYKYFNNAFPTGDEVSIVIDSPLNYSDPAVQKEYASLSRVSIHNKHLKNLSINWMLSFQQWTRLHHKSGNKNTSGQYFTRSLHAFLGANPQFYPDLVFGGNGEIVASRMLMYLKDDTDSSFRKNAMLTLRRDLREKSTLPVYAISYIFIYYEQYAIILQNTIRNIAISASTILIITLPYLVNPKVTLLVFYGFISLMFELFGIMYVWGVSLNALSMIILVMGIGFSVDYSVHVAHAFVKSKRRTSRGRVIEALYIMGSSVAMGGVSTFIGVMVKAFAVNEIFKIFFKMVFGIVLLGLIHGLIILPVHLEIFCRGDAILSHHGNKGDTPNEENVIMNSNEKHGLIHFEETQEV